jgi:hypothetical protein
MKLSICITTFKRREEYVKKLVSFFRSICDNDILIAINSDYKEEERPEYRKRLLRFISDYDNVYPNFYPSFTSLSKMWNELVIHSNTSHCLVLNDDLNISNTNIIKELETIDNDFFTLNGSFAHFVVSQTMLNQMNYFDERLLAFGEEDGDMVWRYIEKFNSGIPVANIQGISNIGEGYKIKPSNMKSCEAEGACRPSFNRKFLFDKKYSPGGRIIGMFGSPHEKVAENLNQYPYEKFKLDNIDNL